MQIRLHSIDTSSAGSFPKAYTLYKLPSQHETRNSFQLHIPLQLPSRSPFLAQEIFPMELFTCVHCSPASKWTLYWNNFRPKAQVLSPSPFGRVHPVELRILFSWPVCYIMLLYFQKKYSVLIFLPLEIKNLSMLPAVILIHLP